MITANKGLEPQVIREYREKMDREKQNYLIIESEDNSDEYVNFYFIGNYQGREVIYDAVMYTLRLHHVSELFEIAEHRAARHFPNYKSIRYKEDENGDLEVLNDQEEEIGLYMAEVMMELEDEEAVKVKEHVEVDPRLDFGVGLDVALNVDKITPEVLSSFVDQYNNGNLKLDETLYAFQLESEEEKVE